MKNLNGYYVGRSVRKWHNFLDAIAMIAIVICFIIAVTVIVTIITLPILS